MSIATADTEVKNSTRATPVSFWFATLGFLGLITLCAGGVPLWGRSVFVIGTGLLLIIHTPRHKPTLLQLLGSLLLLLSHLVHLVPTASFLRPDWWEVATGDYLFELPATLSA